MQQVWDRKKRRYVNADVAAGTANKARIKTESGAIIPASYKTDLYSRWLKSTKLNTDTLGGPLEALDTQKKKPKLEEDKQGQKFASLFNARYGSVVEFIDLEDENGGEGKFFNRRSGVQWSKVKKSGRASENGNRHNKKNPQGEGDNEDNQSGGGFRNNRGGIKVLGTSSRCKYPTSINFFFILPVIINILFPAYFKFTNLSRFLQRGSLREAKGSLI